MKRFFDQILDLRPALVGTAGTGATAYLDGIHTTVGILVGLATLTAIRQKWGNRA